MCGRSASASPGGRRRFGPTKPSGEARSEKIGSVTMLLPPTWISVLAWPIHVTEGTIAAPAPALARREASSASTRGVSCCGGFGRPARAASMRHFSNAPRPFGSNST